MSPEQARGEDVDARTDLFSFGAVLYEMAAGAAPFQRPTAPAVFEAIFSEKPRPPSRLNGDVPAELDRIILKALEKDRDVRYQTAADMRADLVRAGRDIEQSHTAAKTGTIVERPRFHRRYVVAIALILIIGAAVALYTRFNGTRVPSISEWVQMTALDYATQPVFSPDGRMMAFIRGSSDYFNRPEPGEIYVKLLPDGEPVQLTHDGTVKMSPTFSPDSTRIAYTVRGGVPWSTWIVPVLGGTPSLFLPNAFSLTWIDANRVLFSEFREGVATALVSATESRADSRDIYRPSHPRLSVQRSHHSPDQKWVVFVEADDRDPQACKLVPMNGGSEGKIIGPPGQCLDTAWSPDGRWIYLCSNQGGSFHIWRQRFPDGVPEQITFGPTEETSVRIAPDGHSLLTSVGITNSQIWVHDEKGERLIPTDGSADFPSGTKHAMHVFSPDGNSLYYLLAKQTARSAGPELWVNHLDSRGNERVFPGVAITGYEIAPDGKQVAYVSPGTDGKSHIWLAPLDRRFAPRQIIAFEADQPCFAEDGTLFFRGVEGQTTFVFRWNKSGVTEKAFSKPIVMLHGCSFDAAWVIVAVDSGDPVLGPVWVAYSLRDDRTVSVCHLCWPQWSRDGKVLYAWPDVAEQRPLRTGYAFQLRDGQALPELPTGGITADNVKALAVVQTYPETSRVAFYPGRNPSQYAFYRETTQRNIYRIPLP